MLVLSRVRELCEMSEVPAESAVLEESPVDSAVQVGDAAQVTAAQQAQESERRPVLEESPVDSAVEQGDAVQVTAAQQPQEPERRPSVSAALSVKIEVLLKPVGDAPIMKQKKWSVEANKSVAWIIAFVRKYLKMNVGDSLFIFVNQCFAPSPDQTLGNLFECFASDGKLVLQYSTTQAWG